MKKKATVTYTAPQGQAKAVEIAGTILVTGEAKQLVCDDVLMKRLQNIPMLKVDAVSDYAPSAAPSAPSSKPEPEAKKGKA